MYEIDEAWVLRRDREGWFDAAVEAAVMAHVRRHGYPAPAVRGAASRTDLVMERLEGPTMLQAFAAGELDSAEAGALLARLLRELHAVPGRSPDAPGLRVLHLDLHPENVILTADGPRVIDWGTSEDGDPGLDWGMSSVILAQAAVSAEPYAPALRWKSSALPAGSLWLVAPTRRSRMSIEPRAPLGRCRTVADFARAAQRRGVGRSQGRRRVRAARSQEPSGVRRRVSS